MEGEENLLIELQISIELRIESVNKILDVNCPRTLNDYQ